MARLRTLKPSFFTHDVLGELSPLHRLLFQGLWCYADKEGRLEERPRFLKTVVLPYDNCDVGSMLADLADHGFIVRYRAVHCGEEKQLIAIPEFPSHQKPHPKEASNKYPPPPAKKPAGAGASARKQKPRKETHVAQPKENHFTAEQDFSTAQQDLGHVEPGGYMDNGLGDFGLGGTGDTPAAKKPAPAADESSKESAPSKFTQTRDALLLAFQEERGAPYRFTKADGVQLANLVKSYDTPEIERRFRVGLRRPNYPRCDSIAQLAQNWNAYTSTATAPLTRQKRVAAEDNNHSKEDIGRDLLSDW